MIISIGVIIGFIGGYLYWKNIVRSSGNSAINSAIYRITLYGIFMGRYFSRYCKRLL